MTDLRFSSITRRNFMAASAAAGFSALAAPANALRAIPRVGLIGCGAGGAALALARDTADLDLAAVCDVSQAAATRMAGCTGARIAPHWQALVERRDLGAILIATPDHSHAEIALAALAAGKHVFMLPPVASTAAGAQSLAEMAGRSGRVLHVAGCPEFDALWRDARSALESRRGPLRRIHVECAALPVEAPGHWARQRAASLGPAARQVVAMLYPLQYHLELGAPRQMTALAGIFDAVPRETADAVTLTAHYASDVTAVITCAPGIMVQRPVILRGAWPAIELARPRALVADSGPGRELSTFARAIRGEDPPEGMAARLEAACTVQAALCSALDAACGLAAPVTAQAG